jgi:hypothetical protein
MPIMVIQFGSAVAINESGSFVLVGAPMDDEAGAPMPVQPYAFGFGTAIGGNKLLPVADAGDSRAGDMFGASVAFDQNMFVIGSLRR